MARLIRTARSLLPIFYSSASKSITKGVQRHPNLPPRKAISASLVHSRADTTLLKHFPYYFSIMSLNGRLQQRLREYLEAKGVNDELSVFLHQYMMNKDRIELIKWLGKVQSFVEK